MEQEHKSNVLELQKEKEQAEVSMLNESVLSGRFTEINLNTDDKLIVWAETKVEIAVDNTSSDLWFKKVDWLNYVGTFLGIWLTLPVKDKEANFFGDKLNSDQLDGILGLLAIVIGVLFLRDLYQFIFVGRKKLNTPQKFKEAFLKRLKKEGVSIPSTKSKKRRNMN